MQVSSFYIAISLVVLVGNVVNGESCSDYPYNKRDLKIWKHFFASTHLRTAEFCSAMQVKYDPCCSCNHEDLPDEQVYVNCRIVHGERRIKTIRMRNNELRGIVPRSISNLEYLTSLDLRDNPKLKGKHGCYDPSDLCEDVRKCHLCDGDDCRGFICSAEELIEREKKAEEQEKLKQQQIEEEQLEIETASEDDDDDHTDEEIQVDEELRAPDVAIEIESTSDDEISDSTSDVEDDFSEDVKKTTTTSLAPLPSEEKEDESSGVFKILLSMSLTFGFVVMLIGIARHLDRNISNYPWLQYAKPGSPRMTSAKRKLKDGFQGLIKRTKSFSANGRTVTRIGWKSLKDRLGYGTRPAVDFEETDRLKHPDFESFDPVERDDKTSNDGTDDYRPLII